MASAGVQADQWEVIGPFLVQQMAVAHVQKHGRLPSAT